MELVLISVGIVMISYIFVILYNRTRKDEEKKINYILPALLGIILWGIMYLVFQNNSSQKPCDINDNMIYFVTYDGVRLQDLDVFIDIPSFN